MRATVVLPVPGFPVNTRWSDTGTDLRPPSLRSFWILTKSVSSFTSCLIFLSPISLSRSSMGSVSGSFGFSSTCGDGCDDVCAAMASGRISAAASEDRSAAGEDPVSEESPVLGKDPSPESCAPAPSNPPAGLPPPDQAAPSPVRSGIPL